MNNKKILLVILILIGIILLSTIFLFYYIRSPDLIFVNENNLTESDFLCKIDSDCVLVTIEGCKYISVNKGNYKESKNCITGRGEYAACINNKCKVNYTY